ncbi:MAG: 2-oxoacid:acceptor oxidoreductase subunit alpha [Candidatus Wallbacteria bacterium]|nr:2-oxoacid:acceptor oxidoreductase subunit alpha [Candidatus Wallbacteria bacterium]
MICGPAPGWARLGSPPLCGRGTRNRAAHVAVSRPAAVPRRSDSAVDTTLNNFTIQVATVNGSGSQSANLVLLRSIFNMGIPCNGKNLFPSNIAGLPTWFTIRVDERGYACRRKDVDICVAMNENTIDADVNELAPGSVLIYNEALSYRPRREDLVVYPCPFTALAGKVTTEPKLKKLLTNMVYVGLLQELLGLDPVAVEQAVQKQFARKAKAVSLNLGALKEGVAFAREKLTKRDAFKVERRDLTAGKILIEGNAASALGALFGGCTVCAWYPITPSSSLPEAFIDLAGKHRHDKDGKATYAVIQAEDEIASLGMVLGAGWAGARAMTSTSGPGISLMTEFAGLAYFTETPGVVFDVQRAGPSTGLPTRTAQGDILKVACLSHGDTQHIVLMPASVEECFTFGMEAFDLADRFQTPVFVLTDLDLGMNVWMSDPFRYPEKPFDRGKVLSASDLERIGKFERYRDVDGDGIPYRTLPGNPHPLASWFARGSGHNEAAQYTEKPAEYKRKLERLARKFETAKSRVPAPIVKNGGDGEVGLLAYGTSHWAVLESCDQLAALGVKADYARLRALPLPDAVEQFLASHRRVYVVEQNQSGQMMALLRMHFPAHAGKLRSILHYDGMPLDAATVTEQIAACEKESAN